MSYELLLTQLILEGLKSLNAYGELLNASRARGTPITDAEMNQLGLNDDAVKLAIASEVMRQRAEATA